MSPNCLDWTSLKFHKNKFFDMLNFYLAVQMFSIHLQKALFFNATGYLDNKFLFNLVNW